MNIVGPALVIVVVYAYWMAGRYALDWIVDQANLSLSGNQRLAAHMVATLAVIAAVKAIFGVGIITGCNTLASWIPGGPYSCAV